MGISAREWSRAETTRMSELFSRSENTTVSHTQFVNVAVEITRCCVLLFYKIVFIVVLNTT
jgi:hypothetical protein